MIPPEIIVSLRTSTESPLLVIVSSLDVAAPVIVSSWLGNGLDTVPTRNVSMSIVQTT